MKALVIHQIGPASQSLSLREEPKPVPGRGQVLVRMLAAQVNPSDLLYIEGNYGLKPVCPARPGFEGVGVVEASGGGLLGRFRKGKRVAVITDSGCWGEYALASARQVFPVPADLPDELAAGFFVNPMTAVAITRSVLAVPAGETLLQTAAGSALGKMVVRLGKKHGFATLNVVRRPEQARELQALGADQVIVSDGQDLAEQVVARMAGRPLRYAMDCVGGETGSQVVRALGPGGRAILYGLLSGQPVQLDPRDMISGQKKVEGFWLGHWAKTQPVLRTLRLLRSLRSFVREAETPIAAVYPIEQYAQAVEHAARPGKAGKVILRLAS